MCFLVYLGLTFLNLFEYCLCDFFVELEYPNEERIFKKRESENKIVHGS